MPQPRINGSTSKSTGPGSGRFSKTIAVRPVQTDGPPAPATPTLQASKPSPIRKGDAPKPPALASGTNAGIKSPSSTTKTHKEVSALREDFQQLKDILTGFMRQPTQDQRHQRQQSHTHGHVHDGDSDMDGDDDDTVDSLGYPSSLRNDSMTPGDNFTSMPIFDKPCTVLQQLRDEMDTAPSGSRTSMDDFPGSDSAAPFFYVYSKFIEEQRHKFGPKVRAYYDEVKERLIVLSRQNGFSRLPIDAAAFAKIPTDDMVEAVLLLAQGMSAEKPCISNTLYSAAIINWRHLFYQSKDNAMLTSAELNIRQDILKHGKQSQLLSPSSEKGQRLYHQFIQVPAARADERAKLSGGHKRGGDELSAQPKKFQRVSKSPSPCTHYNAGNCTRGDECTYAHICSYPVCRERNRRHPLSECKTKSASAREHQRDSSNSSNKKADKRGKDIQDNAGESSA
jgi:hypothetical protein